MPADVSQPQIDPAPVDLAQAADFVVGGLQVRPSRREVQGGGLPVRLEPRVMKALLALAARPGQVLSREALLHSCWGGQIVGDDAINRCMAKLRQVGRAHDAFEIQSVPRVGYRLTPVARASPAPAAVLRFRAPMLVLSALVVLALGSLAAWLALGPRGLSADTPFAVQPFRAATADPATRAVAATADREIAGAITQSRVATVSPSAHGRRLLVDGLVDGDGAGVHARVRLTDTSSGVTLWTADFSAPAGEAAALRSQMAWRVASIVQATQEALQCRSRDLDPTALALMVQSLDGVNNNTWHSLTAAQALVHRAPRFALGHSMLAANLLAASVLASQGGEALRVRATAEGRLAVALRPDCPDTYGPLMWAADVTHWDERERIIRRTPESHVRALGIGGLLLQTGRLAEGRVLVGQALDTHPYTPAMGTLLVEADQTLGAADDAILLAHRLLAVRPTETGLQAALLSAMTFAGDPRAALSLVDDPARRPAQLPTQALDAYRAFLRWRISGAAAEHAKAIADIGAAARGRALQPSVAVPMFAALGDIDAAFGLADEFATDRRTRFSAMLFDPMFLYAPATAPMRRDLRFIPLVEKLGLLAYWRATGRPPDFCQAEPAPVCRLLEGTGPPPAPA